MGGMSACICRAIPDRREFVDRESKQRDRASRVIVNQNGFPLFPEEDLFDCLFAFCGQDSSGVNQCPLS